MTFAAPRSLPDLLAEVADDGAVALGGGTFVAQLLRSHLLEPTKIVSMAGVAELSGIDEDSGRGLRIGATTTLRECATSPSVRAHAPALAQAAGLVGNPRVRAVATIGGALAHADPRQDLPPVLLVLGTQVRLASLAGTREVPLAGFFLGFLETALTSGELIQEIVVPPAQGRRSAYRRFAPGSQDDFPTVSVAACVGLTGDGTIQDAALAIGGGGAHAALANEAAELLHGTRATAADLDTVADAAAASCAPTSDRLGTADYKRAMIRVMTRRALADCL